MPTTLSGFKDYAGFGSSQSGSPLGEIQKAHTPDSVIQSHIIVATQIVKSMLGLTATEDMIDNDSVNNSIYLLTLFFIENISSQEQQTKFDPASELSFNKVSYYRQRVLPALLKQVVMMIAPYRKVKRFIPHDPPGGGSYATAT